MKQPPRILMISPLFPPMADSEAFCAGKMALALRNAGCDVQIIYCSNYPGAGRKDSSQMWKEFSCCAHDVPLPPGSWIRSLPYAMRYGMPFFSQWLRDAVKLAKQLHAAAPFDLVQSRSLPMISHVAGYHVSRQLNLRWNANLNDPWDFHFFPDAVRIRGLRRYAHAARAALRFRRIGPISNYWMRKTFRTADLVTFCSARLRDYHASFTALSPKSAIVPHIGGAANLQALAEIPGGLRLVHAGKLGANEFTGRSTRTLLQGMAAFVQMYPQHDLDFSLTLVGPEDKETTGLVRALGLEKFVRSIGPVSYEESLLWIARASVCVLVEARMEEGIFFPSKCADYIAMGKPILAFSPEKGVVADLAALGSGITRIHGEDAASVAFTLERYYAAQQKGQLSQYAPDENLRSLCSPEHAADTFLYLCRAKVKQAVTFPRWEKTFSQPKPEAQGTPK
jgi:glycosyltransferase involved in cell wall biosynthesis